MMAPIIVTILFLCYILLATERMTNINKAAVTIFAGTVGWVLYICYGADFVMGLHSSEYHNFLQNGLSTSYTVKQFIAQNIFLKYVGKASEVVLFLLATMSIVEILNINGCFDFIPQLLRTRKSKAMLWILASVTFIISANLDNLTTTVMMLAIIHKIIPNRRYRMVYGAVVLISANCGGVLTVIGEPMGLVLWNNGCVTPTNYSMTLLLPCLVAWAVPTWWISARLPERIEIEWVTMPYRGDDTRLNTWQRALMLFVGIGGLWFIPTFHNITQLSPFLGALCVLSVLWIVNEIFNRKLMNADVLVQRRIPRIFQYGVIQMMLFVMGFMLAIGVVQETGAVQWFVSHFLKYIDNDWLMGIFAGLASTILDNFVTAISFFALKTNPVLNDEYWKIIAYAVAVGGNLFGIGSMSGLILMKTERMRMGWYLKTIGGKTLVGGIFGFAVLYIIINL